MRRVAGRLVGAALVVLGVVTVVFFIGSATGQNAASTRLGPFSSAAQRATFAKANGLDRPLVVQYLHYLGRLLHGDLGTSLVTNQPISHMIAKAFPVTASLAILATLLSAVLSLVVGCLSAMYRGSPLDALVRLFCSIGQSMPVFWVGLMAIELFAIKYKVVPSGGYVSPSYSVGQWLHSMATPVVVLSIPFASVMTRVVRASMIEQLDRDYVRTAKGLGLSPFVIMSRNVLRNGLIAPITILGLNLGGLFGGAVLVESVFRLPGIGMLILTAVSERDFGIVAAASTIAGIAFVVVNLITDLLQSMLNPRPTGSV